ncbi:SRPBCC family protein [Promicromonospora sp. NPDC090134]|uniref:SRPBCC family protein n=1 Tax=Promicromonospora sp. NPDC090134 TaxID=3364408 RepID=UPI00382346B7
MTISRLPRHTSRAAVALTVALGTVLVAAGCSGAQDHDTEAAATANASATAPASGAETPAAGQQCAGQGIDDSAAITRSTDILIDAPLDHVWDVQTDVESWDEWQDAVLTVERLDSGDLASDSRFRWTTPVPESDFAPADTLSITSSVQELEPGVCVLWEGPAVGESITIDRGVHLWTFTETDEGTLVHTEESWDAEILDALEGPDHETVAGMLGGGLDIWLQALKNEAEKQA